MVSAPSSASDHVRYPVRPCLCHVRTTILQLPYLTKTMHGGDKTSVVTGPSQDGMRVRGTQRALRHLSPAQVAGPPKAVQVIDTKENFEALITDAAKAKDLGERVHAASRMLACSVNMRQTAHVAQAVTRTHTDLLPCAHAASVSARGSALCISPRQVDQTMHIIL